MKEGWEIKELQDCLSYIKNGANIKQTKGASGIPITRIETLSGGQFHRDKLGYADVYELGKFAPYVLDDADILMSHINSKAYIGRSVIYHKQGDEQIIHGMNLLRLKFFPDMINPEFANYYFKCTFFLSEVAKIRKDAVNQSSMAISDLKRIAIPVPPLSEQQHIVEELDLLSSIIEKKKAQLNELDNLAQSLFYEMFGDPITNEKGWELSSLKQIGELGRGVSKHRPRNAPELLGGDMPLIQTGDVSNADMYIRTYNSTYSDIGVAQSKIWKSGTLCITIAATIGKCSILEFDACFPDSVVGFTVNMNVCNNEYVYFIFSRLQSILEENAPAVAQKNINLKVLNNLEIPLPPLDLQIQFAEKVKNIEHQKELIKKSIKEVETLFNSRMDYYFN